MKTFKSTLVAMAVGMVGFGAISIGADELEEKNVMVQIHKLGDNKTKVDLNFNGDTQVFNLPDLAIGETKDIVTESGSTISVTKTESSISVSLDGEEINLPAVGGDMAAHFMKNGMPLLTNVSEGIQVIGDLTDEQIAIVKDAFAAAGVEKEVNFSKGNEMHFFISSDSNEGDLEHVQEWLSKDSENVKIIKIDDDNGKLHMESKVIIIETDEEN